MRKLCFLVRLVLWLGLGAGGLAWGNARACAREAASLAGGWRFALDAADQGMAQHWERTRLTGRIRLPGAVQEQGYGFPISTNTPWVLSLYDRHWYLRRDYEACARAGSVKVPFLCQPPLHYLGAAWFQREIQVPETWAGQRVGLVLERAHWLSMVWVDGKAFGENDGLLTPHEYDLGLLAPGSHVLTIRVDNRMLMRYRPDAHSVSDSLAGTWNGIVGRIELQATAPVWLEDVQVFPHLKTHTVGVRARVGNCTGQSGTGILELGGSCFEQATQQAVAWSAGGETINLELGLAPGARTWDEFEPVLQRLTISLRQVEKRLDSREVVFGLREFAARGREFLINGRGVRLRGTHHGGDFPLTGYPATDVKYWRGILNICRQWGLNHVRFHSYCPPEAAFRAADELGIYVQVECGMWNEFSPGSAMESMLYKETRRVLRAYGNHPSLVMVSPSNEPKGRWKEVLPRWVSVFSQEDPRRLYAPDSGHELGQGPALPAGGSYLDVAHLGQYRVRGEEGWFGGDFSQALEGVEVPVVTHELGQWCAYPDYRVIDRFTGYMRPGNFEIFRDSAAAHGVLARNRELARASGRFQFLCYKEEIEANLRTRGLAGFQLLDLHDYVGQGTAPVGLLDPFWQAKGYARPEEFRRFCNSTVPLAWMSKRVLTTAEPLEVPVAVAHYGARPLERPVIRWRLEDAAGRGITNGSWRPSRIECGGNTELGAIHADLTAVAAPQACKLVVRVESGKQAFENDWAFWVYSSDTNCGDAGVVLVTEDWPRAEAGLQAGGRVLFTPEPEHLAWNCPPLKSTPVFWNRLLFPGWDRMVGMWCDVRHPLFREFPVESYCTWQWRELFQGRRAVNVGGLPAALLPMAQPIDDWTRNYKLGLLFEGRVGKGRLLVCAANISRELEAHPAARQLRRAILSYMRSDAFAPKVELPAAALRALWFDTTVQRRLGARAEAEGDNAQAVLDGAPATYWSVEGRKRSPGQPCELTISYPQPISIEGVVLMNRQNDRDHTGDIQGYRLLAAEAKDSQWQEVSSGTLASTWEPQTVRFAAPLRAQRLKLVALSGFGGDTSVALAEFSVLYSAENRK